MSVVQERTELLSAAASWISSDLHFQASSPGPHDDAEMELRDEELDAAARKFVAALEGREARGDDPLVTFVRSLLSLEGDDESARERRRSVSLMSIIQQARQAMEQRR